MNQTRREALLKEYGEVAQNFRTLTDIRFRLLSYLPLVTGATFAVSVIKGEVQTLGILGTLALSFFGLAATIGLTTYNERNDQLYDELVGRAAAIERSLGLPDGNFANRPRAWLVIHLAGVPWKVNHRRAIAIIYGASIALWLSLLFSAVGELGRRAYVSVRPPAFTMSDPSLWVNSIAISLAVALTLWGARRIEKQRKRRSDDMRGLAGSAYKMALALGVDAALKDCEFIRNCAELAGDEEMRETCARASFYSRMDHGSLKYYLPSGSAEEEASHLVALLTDLSPRWVFDSGEDRKGKLSEHKV